MRRSRRSLSLLLGMMAVSLAVVRVTTQPVPEAGKNKTSVTVGAVVAGASKRTASLTERVFEDSDAVELSSLRSVVQEDHSQACRTRTTRAVSAIAVILVIPAPADAAVPRIGWSGCEAYAVGCDHLGRPLAKSKDEEIVGALTARRF